MNEGISPQEAPNVEHPQLSDDFTLHSNVNPFSITKEGYLEKKYSSSWCGYKTRWFLLKNNKLYYFKNKEKIRPSGVLDLDLIDMNIKYEKNVKGNLQKGECCIMQFLLTSSVKNFLERNISCSNCICSRKYQMEKKRNESLLILNPQNTEVYFYLKGIEEDILDWFNLINRSMNNKLSLNNPAFVFKENNFWKMLRISVSVFKDVADTGDIVLFRSKMAQAILQRVLTGGDYDHIGMVIRDDKNRLFILEAISNMGVILTPWTCFEKNQWNKRCSRIVLRRLTWNNSKENLNNLLLFLKKTVGKKYSFKIASIITSKTDQDIGYFCSELIAECWKVMGVISPRTVSLHIWPSNFSERLEGTIKFNPGCQLNNELLVDFSL